MTNEELLSRLPLGYSEFSGLRATGKIYVDKTDLIHHIATTGKLYFLSRPRRFGKSLLISTLASLFAHGTRDFKGLAIEQLWTDKTYPVLRLDFSKVKNFSSLEVLNDKLVELLDIAAEKAGLNMDRIRSTSFNSRFARLLASLPEESLVLLIDEYDAPFTNHLHSPELFKEARTLFSDFYTEVKGSEGVFRHVFMTGITRYSQTSIFSAFNNLIDITFDSKFGRLLGYTDEEIDTYFSEAIDLAALNLSLPRTVLRKRMKEWYDGYCFEETGTTHVYTPWSVLSFLYGSHRGFLNYWYDSGGRPNLLIKFLRAHPGISLNPFEKPGTISIRALATSAEAIDLDPQILLVQTGYLTIKSVTPNGIATIGCPNEELVQSMSRLSLDMALSSHQFDAAERIPDLLENLDIDKFVEEINNIIYALDYSSKLQNESDCRTAIQLILAGSGLQVIPERHAILGRSDLEVHSKKWHWVFELKFHKNGGRSVDALLKDAVAQIISRRYGEHSQTLPLKRLAMVYSNEDQKFVAWDWANEAISGDPNT